MIKKNLLSLTLIYALSQAQMLQTTKGVTLDTDTKLMWQDDADTSTVQKDWQGAKDYCSKLSLGGYHDWRLPDRTTLKALSSKKDSLQNVASSYYWSSTPFAGNSNASWVVGFNNGSENYYDKYDNDNFRCVRDSGTLVFDSLSLFLEATKTSTPQKKKTTAHAGVNDFLVIDHGRVYFGTKEEILAQKEEKLTQKKEILINDLGTPEAYIYFKDYKVSEVRKDYREPLKDEDVTKYFGNATFFHKLPVSVGTCGTSVGETDSDRNPYFCRSKFTGADQVGLDITVHIVGTVVTGGLGLLAGNAYHVQFDKNKMKNYLEKSNFIEIEHLLKDHNAIALNDFDSDDFIDDNIITTVKTLPANNDDVLLYDRETKKWLYVDKTKSNEELVNDWLSEFTKPRTPNPVVLPAEIAKPTLPEIKTLIKDEYETKAEFDKRVALAVSEREEAIKKLQEEYRQDVEKRNKKVDELKEDYQDEITTINKEQESKKEKLKPIATYYTKLAFLLTAGKPQISNPVYDPETRQMYVDFSTDRSNESKRIAFNIKPSDAKNLKNNFASASAEASYEYHDNAIEFKKITVKYDGSKYLCSATQSDFKPQAIQIALKDNKISFDADKQAKMFTLQNPNLVDTYKVSSIQYSENKSVTGQDYNDDLAPLVKKIKQAPLDGKKWLFAISVEKYDEADPVIYATNSANSFISAMQKRLGIDERHTYALLNEKATTGGIKGSLERLLQNVKEGDSIYFYYSGHGIPDPKDGEPYILPRDVIADYVTREKDLMARSLYKKLSDSKASQVVAFVDSCYSGRTDGISNIKGAAAGHFKTKEVEFDKTKMAVFSAGTSGQFSNAFPQKGNRLFTYYLTKDLATKENLELDTLAADVYANVKEESLKMGDIKRQEPQIEGNSKLGLN